MWLILSMWRRTWVWCQWGSCWVVLMMPLSGGGPRKMVSLYCLQLLQYIVSGLLCFYNVEKFNYVVLKPVITSTLWILNLECSLLHTPYLLMFWLFVSPELLWFVHLTMQNRLFLVVLEIEVKFCLVISRLFGLDLTVNEAVFVLLMTWQGPVLLTWFNFNASMDK